MILTLIAALALADIPAPRPAEACDASQCPEGTVEHRWCDTTLGKAPDCADTAGWQRACVEKAGLNARHMMCKQAAAAGDSPAPAGSADPTPDERKPPVPGPPPVPEPEPDPPAAPDNRCQTAPVGGGALLVLAPLLLRRRRA